MVKKSKAKKEQELKKLTWKYFWQYKRTELAWFLFIVILLTIVPLTFGGIYQHYFPETYCNFIEVNAPPIECATLWFQWGVGMAWLALTTATVAVVAVVGFVVWFVIDINWTKATNKAKDELGISRW